MPKKIVVSKSWNDLAAMDDNGMALYATPGDDHPYWASQPSFMYDECVAIPRDFKVYYGEAFSREDECDEVFTAQIKLLDPM